VSQPRPAAGQWSRRGGVLLDLSISKRRGHVYRDPRWAWFPDGPMRESVLSETECAVAMSAFNARFAEGDS